MNTLPENYDDNFTTLSPLPAQDEGAAVEQPAGPTGPDFTKPMRTVVGRQPVKILTTGAANPDFPVVALVKVNGAEVAVNYNLMGEDPELAHVIENIPPIPPVAIGRVLRSVQDDSLVFDSRVFSTEVDARDTPAEGFEFISTYRVVLPQVNESGEQEEIEETDDTGTREMNVNGRLSRSARRSPSAGAAMATVRRRSSSSATSTARTSSFSRSTAPAPTGPSTPASADQPPGGALRRVPSLA
jgi:hypothetical protein